MKARENIGIVFLIFLLLSVFIFFLSKTGFLNKPASVLYSFTSIFQKGSYNLFSNFPFLGNNSEIQSLKDQNLALSRKLVDEKRLLLENKSLHDQFQETFPKSLDLLPAHVAGAPRFLPGITVPETFIIDLGDKDGIKVGSAVVYKNNLVGKVAKTTDSLSEVTLVSNTSSKFAAQTQSGVLGVIKGQGNGDILLDNVLLSDTIKSGDLVVTGEGLGIDGTGLPPGLIIGKITSVDKNLSDLFQKGKVESLINFSKISEVFVIRGLK